METIAQLKNATQTQKRDKEFSSVWWGYVLHRNISIYITYVILRLFPNVTPNFISFLMILVGLSGSVLILFGDVLVQVAGIILVYVSFLLDKVDGEVARYKKEFSLLGMYLDEVYHLLVPTAMLLAFVFHETLTSNIHLLLVMLTLLLTVYRRVERKIHVLIASKGAKLIKEGKIQYREGNTAIMKLLNSGLLRSASIVDRFDLLLLTALVISILEYADIYGGREWFLYGFSLLTIVYFVRRFLLQCSGLIEVEVQTLLQREN